MIRNGHQYPPLLLLHLLALSTLQLPLNLKYSFSEEKTHKIRSTTCSLMTSVLERGLIKQMNFDNDDDDDCEEDADVDDDVDDDDDGYEVSLFVLVSGSWTKVTTSDSLLCP